MTHHACLMLPVPPSTNNLFAGKARRFKSKSYEAWIAEANFALMQQKPLPHFNKPVRLTLHVGRPSKARMDISNRIKAPEDLLVAAGVLLDDSLVHDVRARWAEDVVGVMCELELL